MAQAPFAARAERVARVALPLPVDRLFDYAIPAPLLAEAEVGRRVRVSVSQRALVGVIVALADAPEDEARALRAGGGFALSARGREALRTGAARAELRALLARLESAPRSEAELRRA